MTRPEPAEAGVDRLFGDLLQAGESLPRIRELLARHSPDKVVLLALLRRAVPVRFLEAVGTEPPWSEDARLLGGVVLNPRTPSRLALRVLPALFWSGLAEVARNPRVAGAVRVRAEALLRERLPEMRLGERIALGKIATPVVLSLLMTDPEPKVADACLLNPRLREEDLLTILRQDTVPRALLDAVPGSPWGDRYNVRLALVLQSRTPLPVALAQISSLVPRDLLRVSRTTGLLPLLQLAALRLAEGQGATRKAPKL